MAEGPETNSSMIEKTLRHPGVNQILPVLVKGNRRYLISVS